VTPRHRIDPVFEDATEEIHSTKAETLRASDRTSTAVVVSTVITGPIPIGVSYSASKS
jgi:hypothetical protein